MINFPSRIAGCDNHSPALLHFFFFLLNLVFVLQWVFIHRKNLIILFRPNRAPKNRIFPSISSSKVNFIETWSKSRCTVQNTKEFTKKIRKQNILKDYTMVSFDVVSLFTNMPLEDTINIILRRIYEKKEIVTDIAKFKLRKLLYLCSKNVHFKSSFRMTV